MDIIYSHIEDDWDNASESKEEAAYHAFEDLTDEEIATQTQLTIYKGVQKKQEFKEYLNVESFLEQMGEYAYDNVGELAEDYLENVNGTSIKELEDLICGWAEKHNIKPNWFMVESVESETFSIPDDWKENVL